MTLRTLNFKTERGLPWKYLTLIENWKAAGIFENKTTRSGIGFLRSFSQVLDKVTVQCSSVKSIRIRIFCDVKYGVNKEEQISVFKRKSHANTQTSRTKIINQVSTKIHEIRQRDFASTIGL